MQLQSKKVLRFFNDDYEKQYAGIIFVLSMHDSTLPISLLKLPLNPIV